jgi:serine protease DegQ
MDIGGPFTGGDVPEDPNDEERGSPPRGWLPPEDRLWRHPSEVARLGMPNPVPPLFESGPGPHVFSRPRRGSLVAGVVGAAALATTVAVLLALVDTERGAAPPRPPTGGQARVTAQTTALSKVTAMTALIGPDVTDLVDAVRPSLVELSPVHTATPHATGVVLSGGFVVTAASAVAGLSQLDVFTLDGKRHHGDVIGSDANAGVAVIATADVVAPAATFADEVVQPHDFVVAACLCAGRQSSPAAASVGMVRQVGTGDTLAGGTTLVNVIEAEMPLGHASSGGVLLDGHGRVIGILDGQTSKDNDTLGVFVPAPLAEGVALELAKSHRVVRGWLGINCTDDLVGGATVASIKSGSPAQEAGLEPGDVVVEVASHPVSSVADLQERLYTMPPGQDVQLVVERGTSTVVMTVKLASAPGG